MIFPLEEQKKKSKQERRLFLEELPAKRNTRNQKQFEKILVMQYQNVKLTVGLQRSNQDLYRLHHSSTGVKINKAINSCLSDGL